MVYQKFYASHVMPMKIGILRGNIYEAYLNRKDATGREKFLKSGAGWRFIKKQIKHYLEGN